MEHRLVLLVVLALGAVSAAPAHAQETQTEASDLEVEARARFQLAQLYYSQARFAEAAAEFEAAYAIHPHPLLLHNVYLARRDLGDLPGAADALSRYLETAEDLSAADRRVLEGRLATTRRQIAESAPDEPTEATESTESTETTESTDEPTPDELAEDGEPSDEDPEVTTPEAPAPAAPDDGLMNGAITAFSVAGVAVVAMAITGSLALVERSSLESACAPACTDGQVATMSSLGVATDVGLGVALAGAAVGATLAIVASMTSAPVAVVPSVSSEHAAIVVGGQF